MGRWTLLIAQGIAAFGLGFYFLATGEKLEETFVPRVICQVWNVNERCSALLKKLPSEIPPRINTQSELAVRPAEPERSRPQVQSTPSNSNAGMVQGTVTGPRTSTDEINNVLRGK